MTELRDIQKRLHEAQAETYRQGWTAQEAVLLSSKNESTIRRLAEEKKGQPL